MAKYEWNGGVPQRVLLISAIAAAVMAGVSVRAQDAAAPGRVMKGTNAFGDWHEDAPGLRRLITLQDMPAVGPERPNESEVAPIPAGAQPRVPDGFRVEMVASGLAQPRVIRVAPNGDLFVANSKANEVRVYRVPPGSSTPAISEVFATGLHQPYGIAFYPPGPYPTWMYVGNSDGVVRFRYQNGDLNATGSPETIISHILWTHHWTRDIVFSADGTRLLLAVGSGSNAALDMFPKPHEPGGVEGWAKNHPLGAPWDTEERRANILSFDPDGRNEKIVATGLRNPAGIAIQFVTGQLWAVINERDGLGDDTPPDYATHVQEGAFYGWPWYFIGAHEDPRLPGARPDLKDKVTHPDVLIQAHSAALQIAFYDGDNFPPEYRGSAFVTLHGSWDRQRRTGYKVIRLLFDKSGKPTGEYEDFMTGFVISDKQVWGRPVGVAVAKDGSLFVGEDGNGTIWRVTHQKPVH